jgi:hypothetical protein
MNTYEFDIWKQVKHNDKFSHTYQRVELVHALNEERAKAKLSLKPAESHEMNGHKTEVGAEFIYSSRRTGTVTIQPYYVYSDGRSPRPVKRGGGK